MVLDAHGSLDRWHDIETLTVHARVGGELWGRRGQEGILADVCFDIDPRVQRLIFRDYPEPGRRGVFDMPRTAPSTGTTADWSSPPGAACCPPTPTAAAAATPP